MILFSVVSKTEVIGQGLSEDSQRIGCQTVGLECDALQTISKFREFNTLLEDSQLC